MKTILKTLPVKLEMKYDEKFTSEANADILRDIIPRLVDALKRYRVTYKQVKEWLQAYTSIDEYAFCIAYAAP